MTAEFVVAIAVVTGAVFLWKRETARAGFVAIVGGVLGGGRRDVRPVEPE